jgi:hypothetical protein
MTKMPELLPHEEQRLRELLRRSDAISQVYDAVFDTEDWGSVEMQAQTLWILGEMSAEAHEEFAAYRTEMGISGPSHRP